MEKVIDELLRMPFSFRTRSEQIRIVREGKPRPHLNKSTVTFRATDGIMITQEFDPQMYDHVQWLTACEKSENFFCWPCLLFMPRDVWNNTGIHDLSMLINSMPQHEKSTEHAQAELHLQFFSLQHLKKTSEPQIVERQFNSLVLRNREIVKRLIDSICYIVMKDVPSSKRSDCFRIKIADCVKTLKLIQSHNEQHADYIDDGIEVINIAPSIVHDLADVITNIVKLEIKKEIQYSTFVSLILSEHTSIPSKPQISTFLRYVKDGKVYERFVGFTNMPEPMCPFKILLHISKIIEEYGIANKLIAQSLDGAFLQSSTLYEVIDMLKTNYPFSYFVPCYFHSLQQVLRQNLSESKECGLFFKNLNAVEAYFQNDKTAKDFEFFMFGNPNFRNKKWCVQSEFIKVLSTCRAYFVQFLESIPQNSKKWTGEEITNAFGFLQFLKNFKSVFLLQVLSKLLEHTETLEAKLKSNSPESAFNTAVVVSVISDLTREKVEGFEKFWYGTIKDLESGKKPASKRIKTENDVEIKYRELFSNIVNRVIYEIQCRFASLDSLEFCRVLDNGSGLLAQNNSGAHSEANACLQKLMETHQQFFDEFQMRNELMVLSSHRSLLYGKNVYDLLKYFAESDGRLIFKNFNRLAELILTLPLKPPAAEGSDSKIEKVWKLSYIPKSNEISGDISILCVESDIISELRKNVMFYNEVINGFSDINKTIELVHKPL